MDFRGSYQPGGYPPGPPIGDSQANKRNGQRIIPQGNMSPQAIYLDQGYYINAMQQQQPIQQVHQVSPYGRAVGSAGPQSVGGGNIHVIGAPQQGQPPQIQTITSNSAAPTSAAPAYVVPGGAYITTPTNPYQYQVYAQSKQLPNTMAAPISQNMAYAQLIPEGEPVYQQPKQYMSRSPKPIQTPTNLASPQIPLKNVKPEINMPPSSQMQSHYGVAMNNQMRQQQQMIQQQDNEAPFTSSDTFRPNFKQPPGLFNIVSRGNLPAFNFVCDSCYETE